MNATERHVTMAAQLYEMRRSARRLLGDSYAPKMKELGAVLEAMAAAKKVSVLSVAIQCAKGTSGMQTMQILAAAVELTEPSEVESGNPIAGTA